MYPTNYNTRDAEYIGGTVVSVNEINIQYAKIDNMVFGTGSIDIDTNIVGAGSLRFAPPVASNFTNGSDAFLSGVGSNVDRVHGYADPANNHIWVFVQALGNSNGLITFSFSYEVK
jgi:hypothetical protein